MKLYISEATLRTIEKFGSASLTHISATPSDHMSIELDAAPLATEASKPAPSVEQDERGACDRYQVLNEAGEALLAANHGEAYEVIYRMMKDARAASTSANVAQEEAAAWFYYEDDEFIRMYDSEEKAVAACEKFGGHWEPVFKHPARKHDRFDPYRLKVAEECCERLMSACTDAGCPDGVRMDDWIRENVRSTSANVAQGLSLTAEQSYAIKKFDEWASDKGLPAYSALLTESKLPSELTHEMYNAADAAGFGHIAECDLQKLWQTLLAANVAQGAVAVATVKVYETYTGQNGWIEVTQEEYDRTKDKYEHRIRRVPAPPAQTALTDEARECLADVVSHYRALYAGLAFQLNEAAVIENSDDMTYWKHEIKALERMYAQAERALTAAQSASGDTK